MKPSPRKTGFYISDDSAKLYYEIYGDSGPIVILTYGIACLINHWHFQIEDLAQDHRVLVYDIRGHHKSSRGTKEITVDLLARDALNLFHFNFPKENQGHFVGHSFGAPISLRCASLEPKMVASSIYINGFYKNPFEERLSVDACLSFFEGLQDFAESAPSFSKWLWTQAIENFLFQYFASVTGGFNMERTPKKDIEIYTKSLTLLNLTSLLDCFKALVKFDGHKYLKSTESPVYIVYGDRDGIVPLSQNKELDNLLPHSYLIELREGSHASQLDLPQKVNQIIRECTKFKNI